MTIEEALPVEGGGEAVPGVGIFWGLRAEADARTILSVGVSLTEAEAYGDCLTYPGGHHDVWEAWRRLPPAELQRRGLTIALREHEYDAVPRGRIVYEVGAARFILYADRRLQTPALILRIKAVFGLNDASVRVRSDAHYRTPPGA